MIELLVAVVILAVGLLGLAQLQVTAIKTNSQSMTSTASSALAQQIIEEVVSLDADEPLFDTMTASPQAWTPSSYTMAGGGTYNVTYEVEAVDADGPTGASAYTISNLVLVTIRVTSTTQLQSVLGPKTRTVVATTLKRVI